MQGDQLHNLLLMLFLGIKRLTPFFFFLKLKLEFLVFAFRVSISEGSLRSCGLVLFPAMCP